MVSFVAIEVNCVMMPALVLFLLYILPIQAISKAVTKGIHLMEKPNISGLTILSALAIICSFAFLGDFMHWQDTYGTSRPKFADISLALQYDTKRLRVERNMYIHILSCVLALALKKISTLSAGLQKAKRQ